MKQTEECQSCSWCNSKGCQGLSVTKIIIAVVAAIIMVLVLLFLGSKGVAAREVNCITKEEVEGAANEGKCLVTYEGKIYDFTEGAKLWDLEGHAGQHLCGQEYAGEVIEAGPHGVEVMEEFYLGDLCSTEQKFDKAETVLGLPKVLGVTWRRLSSWLALVFFVLNFATCYAMPWARGGAPWAGERPGKDKKDQLGHFPLTHWHGAFAWLAIFFLSVHGLLLFACVLLGKCL